MVEMQASREAVAATLGNYFSPLAHYTEQMMLTREQPYPVERTLLTAGLFCAGTDSLFQGRKRVQTPQHAIHYQLGESTLRRI